MDVVVFKSVVVGTGSDSKVVDSNLCKLVEKDITCESSSSRRRSSLTAPCVAFSVADCKMTIL